MPVFKKFPLGFKQKGDYDLGDFVEGGLTSYRQVSSLTLSHWDKILQILQDYYTCVY